MGRKKKANNEMTTAPKATKKKGAPKSKYTDPCFHCQNLELTSAGMKCRKECAEFWNDLQGFEKTEHSGAPGDLCKSFMEFGKPPVKPTQMP